MQLQVSQLIPGYILTEDVTGKTKHPIMKKDTKLTKEHILVLQNFLVETVHVAKHTTVNKNVKHVVKKSTEHESFIKKYENAIIGYKKHFEQWQNNLPINMPEIRRDILPLLEYIDQLGIEIYQLYKYSIPKDYMYHHDVSVAILSAYLAKKLGYKKGEWIQIGLAGLLSNCGQAKLAQDIFMKKNELTYLEKKEIAKYPIHSFKMLESTPLIKETVKLAVLQHHERLDGSGYPLGTSADKIHPYAKIIAICDIYCAMTSDRLYKKAQSPFKVIEELKKLQNEKLDTKIVDIFIKDFLNLSLGKKVILSNFEIGTITSMDENRLQNSLILLDHHQSIISLADEQDLFIKDFI